MKKLVLTSVIFVLFGCDDPVPAFAQERSSTADYIEHVEATRSKFNKGCNSECRKQYDSLKNSEQNPNVIILDTININPTFGPPTMYDRVTDPYFSGSGVNG